MQVVTSVAAVALEYVPPTHAMQDAEPAGDQPPVVHGVQLVDPNAPELVPASHAMHADCPVYGLKLPWLHMAHANCDVAAAVAELVPTGHAEHVPWPRSVLKYPIEHAAHGPPSGPV